MAQKYLFHRGREKLTQIQQNWQTKMDEEREGFKPGTGACLPRRGPDPWATGLATACQHSRTLRPAIPWQPDSCRGLRWASASCSKNCWPRGPRPVRAASSLASKLTSIKTNLDRKSCFEVTLVLNSKVCSMADLIVLRHRCNGWGRFNLQLGFYKGLEIRQPSSH